MALDFAAGCLGGCAGIVVGYPLDTVKVHMQTQDYRNPKYKGTLHCLRTLIMKESVMGLYRGMTSPMAGVAVVNAIVFGVYGQAQKYMADSERLSYHFLAGLTAGIAQAPICSPIELAKTRMQLQSAKGRKFSGPLECLKHIYKSEGYRGVFNGMGITFLREAPSFGVYFLTYEALTQSKEPISTFRMLLAGGLAGTASWTVSYPLDVIKSRMQAESRSRYSSPLDCFRQSVSAEGYGCLYRGLNSTILRAFPTNAATFAVVAWTFRIFGEQRHETPSSEEKFKSRYESFVENWNTFLENGNLLWQTYCSTEPIIAVGWMLRDTSLAYHHDGPGRHWSRFDMSDQRTRESFEITKVQVNHKEENEKNKTENTDDNNVTMDNTCKLQCSINASKANDIPSIMMIEPI